MNDQSEKLQSAVVEALDSKSTLTIIGANSKAFYGREVEADQTLDVSGHSGIVSYDPAELAITVRAGTTLRELEKTLAEHHQELPFEPPDFSGKSTIGGAVAAGLSGPRRPYAGAVRDAMLGAKIINGRGEILEFGGQVMKNVAGYDVSRLLAGSLGTLGVILELSLKSQPIARHQRTYVQTTDATTIFEKFVHLRQHAANITATAFDGERLFVRLIGEQTMAASWGGVESLEDDTNFWQQIKNQQHSFFQDDKPLWRISLPPATSMLTIPGETLIEWGGGLCWLKSHSPEPEIRDLVLQQGGHATLFRANGLSAEPFQPLPAVLFKLHQQLKKSLDPQGIFNPGKMYSGL
jgi:glycolate oxidase FAD binding subunit